MFWVMLGFPVTFLTDGHGHSDNFQKRGARTRYEDGFVRHTIPLHPMTTLVMHVESQAEEKYFFRGLYRP